MRDPRRIPRILEKIEKLWSDMPDLRFGQLLINLGMIDDSSASWNTEDDLYEDQLNYWIDKMPEVK